MPAPSLSLSAALSAAIAMAVLALAAPASVAATAQLHDAYEFEEPLARAVMECSDIITPAIGEASGGKQLYVDLARACCDEPALLLTEGHSARIAIGSVQKCFSRTLFPKPARQHVDRLLRCVMALLAEADD